MSKGKLDNGGLQVWELQASLPSRQYLFVRIADGQTICPIPSAENLTYRLEWHGLEDVTGFLQRLHDGDDEVRAMLGKATEIRDRRVRCVILPGKSMHLQVMGPAGENDPETSWHHLPDPTKLAELLQNPDHIDLGSRVRAIAIMELLDELPGRHHEAIKKSARWE
jgi:hypothetical protein